MTKPKKITNVFADLGLPDADDLLARAELTRQIYTAIKDRGLSQKKAGEVLGLQQPDVSLLMRAKYTRFSTDRLLKLLVKLGRNVEIVVRAPRSPKMCGKVTVIAA
ncbi:MAG: helix-turn-helix transcriptional regulator [Rhodospirillaceae bacterium]|nr:helix-turn-helix transcriptional regulator [Rhodospirillaceae bacterium]